MPTPSGQMKNIYIHRKCNKNWYKLKKKHFRSLSVVVNVRFEFVSNPYIYQSWTDAYSHENKCSAQLVKSQQAEMQRALNRILPRFNGGKVRMLLIFAFVIISLKLFFSSLWHFWMSYFFNHTMFTLELIFYITIYSNGYRFWRIV